MRKIILTKNWISSFLYPIFIIFLIFTPLCSLVLTPLDNWRLDVQPSSVEYEYIPVVNNTLYSDDDYFKTSNLRNPQVVDAGNYSASYSFDDEVGLTQTDITFVDSADCDIVQVNESYLGHDTILYCYDDSNPSIYHYFESTIINSFTLETWIIVPSGTVQFRLYDLNGHTYYIRCYIDRVRVYNFAQDSYDTFYDDFTEWKHLKIHLDFDDDQISISVDGFEVISDFDVNNDISNCTHLRLYHWSPGPMIIDAMGFSFDPNYEIDDNLFEILNDDTSLYEVDKQCFHQTEYDSILSNGYYDDSLLWVMEDDSGGDYDAYAADGGFQEPELKQVNMDNKFMRVGGFTTDAYDRFNFSRYFDNQSYDIVNIKFDWSYSNSPAFPGGYAGFYLQNSAYETFLSLLFTGDGVDSNNLTMYNPDDSVLVFQDIDHDLKLSVDLWYSESIAYVLIDTFIGNTFYDSYNATINIAETTELYKAAFVLFGRGRSGGTESHYFYLDNVGFYFNGVSQTNNSEFGYMEYQNIYDDITKLNIHYQGNLGISISNPVGSEFLVYDDAMSELVEFDSYTDLENIELFDFSYDSILIITNSSFYSNYTLDLDKLYLTKNGIFECYAEYMSDSGVNLNTTYDDSPLSIYQYRNSSTNQNIVFEFDIENFQCLNYSFKLDNLYRSNLDFNPALYVYFLDNTNMNFSLAGTLYESGFSDLIGNYKNISYVRFEINSTSDETNSYCGFTAFKIIDLKGVPFDSDIIQSANFLTILAPIIVLIAPTLMITFGIENKYKGMGIKLFIPILFIMAVILFAMNVLPTWLFFIILFSCIGVLLIKWRAGQ